MTRRSLVGSVAASSLALKSLKAERAAHITWKPRLGILGQYSPSNVEWAHSAGFRNMILGVSRAAWVKEELADTRVEEIRSVLAKHQMPVSALQFTANHISADADERQQLQGEFKRAIILAGKLGVPYIGTASGRNTALPFAKQVDEIVRVYHDQYFSLCEKHHVRILWEPYPGSENLAISPDAFAALFKAFDNSPYVGLQYDPSHLVRGFMDPIQTARDFVNYICDVHLKDTEILWPVLRQSGIHPVNGRSWWRYRIPGMGSISWRDFFSVLQDAGYKGAMSIEQEDPLYGGDENDATDFKSDFKLGYLMAKRYLDQYVPNV